MIHGKSNGLSTTIKIIQIFPDKLNCFSFSLLFEKKRKLFEKKQTFFPILRRSSVFCFCIFICPSAHINLRIFDYSAFVRSEDVSDLFLPFAVPIFPKNRYNEEDADLKVIILQICMLLKCLNIFTFPTWAEKYFNFVPIKYQFFWIFCTPSPIV